ncbi:MAG: hypothetical protein JWR15_2937 [Prosthecobacter sp.]|nr:hypothetical protein [Prosthecobacter sp.]
MNAPLDSLTADGRVVITFPGSAVPTQERESFTEKGAKALANEVDIGWWNKNRERILRSISEA